MATNKTKLTKSNAKFTLKQFIWNGFNFTVGIPFLGSLALLANSPKDTPGAYGLGFHIIWIFLLMGIIASICAYAFAKLSRYHKQDNNGGAYIFARSSFGRFVGFLVLFLNYIIMPMLMSNQILMFVKANFDPAMSTGSAAGGYWWCDWTKHLGNWSYLSYDLIGLGLAIVFAVIAFFGAKTYKKVAKFSLLIKWITGGFLILFGIIAAALPANANNAANWANHSDFNFSHFLSAFCACFYYFTGFEAFASANSTLKDQEKSLSKGIMIVMFFSVAFYIAMIVIFMLGQTYFTQNINTGFWIMITNASNKSSWLYWLIYVGPIIMIVSTVAMRGNIVSQSVLYGGTTLQPMSTEGYISNRFAELNGEGFPIGAMRLHITICLITVGMWAIIPDIIVGILGPDANFININTIISASSVFYIVIYAIILLAVLKYAFEECIKNSVIEWILYPIALASLAVVAVDHFYDLFRNAIEVGGKANISALIMEMAFFTLCALFVICVYFGYYRRKYRIRMILDPKKQEAQNYHFRTLDGWNFLKGKFHANANEFFEKRIKFVNDNFEEIGTAEFNHQYKHMSHHFMQTTKLQVAEYLQYSKNIKIHNEQQGLNVKAEINQNHEDAYKFLANLQRSINKKPLEFIKLQTLS